MALMSQNDEDIIGSVNVQLTYLMCHNSLTVNANNVHYKHIM